MEPVQKIDGRGDFHDAVRACFAEAAAAGWPELWLCDADFANWPLGERSVVDSLTLWSGARRRMQVLALDYAELARRHPRWAQWRRYRAHAVECRTLREQQADDVPVMLHAPGGLTLRLFDARRYLGSVSRLANDAQQASELFDALLQQSALAFPPTTLGL